MNDKQMHFLVVDDDGDSRSTVKDYLIGLGYQKVTEAVDGTDALRAVDRDPSINFIISDWEMPLMDGLTLLQRVRSIPARSNIPFLIITSPASAEAEKVMLAAENYVDAYIIKPFRSLTLKEKIESMLAKALHGPRQQALVVDDDPDAREMVCDYLKHFGFRDVHTERDGAAALEYLTRNHQKIGLIVADWEMPNMNGLDLLRRCKAREDLAEIPYLMVTSQSSMERMKVMQAAKEGVDQYLLKPFQSDQLKDRIRGVLQKSSTRKLVDGFLREGHEHLERGAFSRAHAAFEQALKLDEDHDGALTGLADATVKTKGPNEAVPIYQKALDKNPYNAKSYIRLATVYEQLGLIEKGITLLQAANEQVSFNADLHFYLGRLYNKKGMISLAQTEFEKTLEIQMDHQQARVMLDMVLARKPD